MTNDVKEKTVVQVAKSRRGRKSTGVAKNNICVRLTEDSESYLENIGNGSKSLGVDRLIDLHRKKQI